MLTRPPAATISIPGSGSRSGLLRVKAFAAGSGSFTSGDSPIRRPMKAPVAPTKDGPRTNREIRAREVQLIDQGVVGNAKRFEHRLEKD